MGHAAGRREARQTGVDETAHHPSAGGVRVAATDQARGGAWDLGIRKLVWDGASWNATASMR